MEKSLTAHEKQIRAIKNLMELNRDRIEGYKKGIETIENEVLREVFYTCADQSVENNSELDEEMQRLGWVFSDAKPTTPNADQTLPAWAALKYSLSGKDNQAILAACELGEDTTLSAYESVIKNSALQWEAERLFQLLKAQQEKIKGSFEQIHSLAGLH